MKKLLFVALIALGTLNVYALGDGDGGKKKNKDKKKAKTECCEKKKCCPASAPKYCSTKCK